MESLPYLLTASDIETIFAFIMLISFSNLSMDTIPFLCNPLLFLCLNSFKLWGGESNTNNHLKENLLQSHPAGGDVVDRKSVV